MKRALERSAYLFVLGTSLALALALIAWRTRPELVGSITFLFALGLTSALERIAPHVAAWHPRPREAAGDAGYLALGVLVQRGVNGALAVALTITGVSALGTHPSAVPQWLLALGAFLVADLAKYGLHRAAHELPWLWRFHATHHAPTRMYALNGIRIQPVNLAWNITPDLLTALAFGVDPAHAAFIAAVRSAVAVLQHANVALASGPLDHLLSTPTLHQWHHSADLAESRANYGSTLIVWDTLFGTRRLPRGTPARLGLADEPVREPRSITA